MTHLSTENVKLLWGERAFAARVLKVAQTGKVEANNKVMAKGGAQAVLYFGAGVFDAMICGGLCLAGMVTVWIMALTADTATYWIVASSCVAVVWVPIPLFIWRFVQYRRVCREFAKKCSSGS